MAGRNTEEELNSIVASYGLQDDGATFEDPDPSLYHSTDRYGFIHTSPVQDKLTERQAKLESERSIKWSSMLSEWQKYRSSNTLHRSINEGIPNSMRGQVWKHLLDIESIKQADLYEGMKVLGCRTSSMAIRQINADVPRTFPNHAVYRERHGPHQQSLFRVLLAYSVYNPDVRYSSGMSFVAGLLLMYLSEEDTFWAMVMLLGSERYAMHGLMSPGRPRLMDYCDLHQQARKRLLPKLDQHFVAQYIEPMEYCGIWFIVCYIDALPFQLLLRIWDKFLYHGESIIMATSLTLLKIHRKTLLSMRDEDGMNIRMFLKRMSEHDFDEDSFILELDSVNSELVKLRLAIPPPTVQLQGISQLNDQAMSHVAQNIS